VLNAGVVTMELGLNEGLCVAGACLRTHQLVGGIVFAPHPTRESEHIAEDEDDTWPAYECVVPVTVGVAVCDLLRMGGS
jgi:hypothetical protein